MRAVQCPHCEGRFLDVNGLYQHARSKHSKKQAKALRPKRVYEPSLGEELAEAQIAWQIDRTPPPEHLKLMFPEAFQ